MQLSKLPNLSLLPVWYFVFGAPEKTSYSAQYALEHNMLHFNHPSETTLREHERRGAVIEGSVELFRSVERWRDELTAVFLPGSKLSEGEAAIARDYEMIGRAEFVPENNYPSFRKELNPQLIIVYGASELLINSLLKSYFDYIGYYHVSGRYSANQLLALPKGQNYMFTDLVPEPEEVAILHTYYHTKIVHLRHNRTELADREAFFDREAQITPLLQGRPYYHAVSGYINDVIEQVGRSLLPEMLYANVHEADERAAVRRYAEERGALLLNVFEIQEVLRRKANKAAAEVDKTKLLVEVIFLNFTRSEIVLTDFPFTPQEFAHFESHTRHFRLFADCVRPEHYQFSKQLNSPIYFLETGTRKQIHPDLPFESQVAPHTKYLLVTGAPCAGKTSAAKFIASEMGYRHIEYEPYLASVKEKLIAPEDGEELPFRKVIAHFASLVAASATTPLVIDGLPLDAKDVEAWTKAVGPATVLNLKVEEKELIRRTRRKAEADVNAEVGEEELGKAREAVAKNAEWTELLTARSPLSTLYQVQFSQALIVSEQLLRDILRPRVYLVQDNMSLVFQNLAIRHELAFFNLYNFTLQQVAERVRTGNYRDVMIANYRNDHHELICKDFYWIEKHIGNIRYLAVWNDEPAESHDEPLTLERPPAPEKPKLAEGEEPPADPPAEEEGEKKKAFNIHDHTWTKPGNQKNLSQWYHTQKRNPIHHQHAQNDLAAKGLGAILAEIAKGKEVNVYHKVIG